MKKTLLVIDMQNDFIDMALGTKEAVSIVPKVKEKIKECNIVTVAKAKNVVVKCHGGCSVKMSYNGSSVSANGEIFCIVYLYCLGNIISPSLELEAHLLAVRIFNAVKNSLQDGRLISL